MADRTPRALEVLRDLNDARRRRRFAEARRLYHELRALDEQSANMCDYWAWFDARPPGVDVEVVVGRKRGRAVWRAQSD